jgi:hypothetical protein
MAGLCSSDDNAPGSLADLYLMEVIARQLFGERRLEVGDCVDLTSVDSRVFHLALATLAAPTATLVTATLVLSTSTVITSTPTVLAALVTAALVTAALVTAALMTNLGAWRHPGSLHHLDDHRHRCFPPLALTVDASTWAR